MTQTSTTAQTGPYNGNGSTVAFDYDFRILADADIVVTLTSAAGLDTVKTLTTDYTVSGAGSASGGTVTMNVAPATGEKLTLTRATTLTQTLDLQNRKVVSPELLEDALDKLTLAAQDLDARVDRSVKISVASDASDLDTLLANINGLAALESEIGTLAGISSDITTVSGISANVTTVAGVAANVTTVAGISTDVSDVAAIDAAVSTVAGIDSDVTTLAGLSAEIQILAAGGAVSLSVFGITATAAELNELDGVSSIGGDLVRAADAAAQRTVLGLDSLVVPSGAVFWFAANSPPTGYLECDGSAVSRSTYAALFAVVGTTFGVGDGSTTFDLPDLRGEFIRGWDNSRGIDSGRTFGSFQLDEFKEHSHSMPDGTGNDGAQAIEAAAVIGTIQTGLAGGVETRPRNIALLPCIKT